MVNHDVVRFDVTVHDSHAVTVVQSLQKPSGHQSVALYLTSSSSQAERKSANDRHKSDSLFITLATSGRLRIVRENEGEKTQKTEMRWVVRKNSWQ